MCCLILYTLSSKCGNFSDYSGLIKFIHDWFGKGWSPIHWLLFPGLFCTASMSRTWSSHSINWSIHFAKNGWITMKCSAPDAQCHEISGLRMDFTNFSPWDRFRRGSWSPLPRDVYCLSSSSAVWTSTSGTVIHQELSCLSIEYRHNWVVKMKMNLTSVAIPRFEFHDPVEWDNWLNQLVETYKFFRYELVTERHTVQICTDHHFVVHGRVL